MKRRYVSHDSAVLPIPALRDLNAPAQRKSRRVRRWLMRLLGGLMSDPIYCWNLPLTDEQMTNLMVCIRDSMEISDFKIKETRAPITWEDWNNETKQLYSDVLQQRKRIEVQP
jgi:hypothetical protein